MLGEQKNVADDIIAFLKKREGRETLIVDIILTVEKKIHSQPDIRYVIKILKHKGFIEYTSPKQDECFLTDKGWLYEDYDKLLAEENYQKWLSEKQIKTGIDSNVSVELTNKVIQENIPTQNNLTRISLGIAALSVIFIVITVVQDCNDTTSKELKGIQQQLKEQSHHTKDLLEEIKKIDHNLKNMGKDSARYVDPFP